MPRESQKPSGTPSGAASTAPPVYQPVPARELVQAKMVQHGMRAGFEHMDEIMISRRIIGMLGKDVAQDHERI